MLVLCSSFGQANANLDSRSYAKMGLSFATKNYFGKKSFNLDYESNIGFAIDKGRIFNLGIPMNEKTALGIDFTYIGVNFNYFTYYNNTIAPQVGSLLTKDGSIYLHSKAGPVFSYSPNDAIVMDAYLKANLGWIGLAFSTNDDFGANGTDMWGGFLGLGYTAGANFCFKHFLISVEYNMMRMKMESADYEGNYLPDHSDLNKTTTPLPSINLTLGGWF